MRRKATRKEKKILRQLKIKPESQLKSCTVLGTVDQLLIDSAIMDEVREKKRNLAVSFYDYQKAYDMVRHD